MDKFVCLTRRVDLNGPECASNKVAEEREQMMLETAEHIQMTRAQRKICQEKVSAARRTVDRVHSKQTYTLVIDYGQNMVLPIFSSEQPSCT